MVCCCQHSQTAELVRPKCADTQDMTLPVPKLFSSRGVYAIEILEKMLHEKSWGRILANLGGGD